ncbi:hypothetical protein NESM_000852900 [Novymonas esmeraldas]|uniref:Leucine-rich repeat-containing N-terminal plant-type domain-containing protein n=1 Tax=Novymonas esmeraldas TaxID=1808958 RepID=A0AAW0EWZ5_9TRYP
MAVESCHTVVAAAMLLPLLFFVMVAPLHRPATLVLGDQRGGAAPHGDGQGEDSVAALLLQRFSAPEQHHTLQFLLSFTQTMPDLSLVWTGDNYCAWPAVQCSDNSVMVDLTDAPSFTSNASLPDLADNLNGAQVAVVRIAMCGAGSRLQGTLPSSWGRLRRLRTVLLAGGALTGTLPAAWSGMKSLRTLFVSVNELTGTLPDTWHALGQLRALSLGGNDLTGPLPVSWGNTASSLRYVELAGNALCGCVPAEWRSNTQLRVVCDAALESQNCSTANSCV